MKPAVYVPTGTIDNRNNVQIYRLIDKSEGEQTVVHESQNPDLIFSAYRWLSFSGGKKHLTVTVERNGSIETLRPR